MPQQLRSRVCRQPHAWLCGGPAPQILIERVRGDPAGHQHHRHARPGVRGAAGQVQPADLAAAVPGLEGAENPAVARQPVDGAVEHAVAVVDVLRRQGPLEHDPALEVGQARGARELVEDHPSVAGQHRVPVVVRPQVGRVDEDVERFAAGRRHTGLGAGRGGEIAGRVRGGLAAW